MAVEVHTNTNQNDVHQRAESFDVSPDGHLFILGNGAERLAAYSPQCWRSVKVREKK